MSERKRKILSSQQKAKVALKAVRGIKTVNEIAQKFAVHPTQVELWKKALQEQASGFDAKRGPMPVVSQQASGCFRIISSLVRCELL